MRPSRGIQHRPSVLQDRSFGDLGGDAHENAIESRRRDAKTDEAKVAIRRLFEEHADRVFYVRQLQVLLEDKFFHWITARALDELEEEGFVRAEMAPLMSRLHVGTLPGAETAIRLVWFRGNRYWRRRAETVRKLVAQFSSPEFGRALGRHGEQMFDAALPRAGFLPRARNVREYRGGSWTATAHDLDRVFERDGVAYGAEVKNTLDYITLDELRVKLRMCEVLGLKPLFIVRMAPKSYVEEVRRAGGFTLIFKFQLYPHGHGDLAERVRRELGLPVDCPAAVADGTVRRLLNRHLRVHGLGVEGPGA